MNDLHDNWLNKIIRYGLLRGSGWKRRRMPAPIGPEWRDPLTGIWYREKKAFLILQDQAIAIYDRKDQPRRPFGLRC
jgi:hypothetical protein